MTAEREEQIDKLQKRIQWLKKITDEALIEIGDMQEELQRYQSENAIIAQEKADGKYLES